MKKLEKYHDVCNKAIDILELSKDYDDIGKYMAIITATFGMVTNIAEDLAILVDGLEEVKKTKKGAGQNEKT